MVIGGLGAGGLLNWMDHSCPGVMVGGESQLESQGGKTLYEETLCFF